MTYDTSLFSLEEKFILKVANFTKEGLVTPEGVAWEKVILKINLSLQGIEPWSAARKVNVLTTTLVGNWYYT